MGKSFLSRRYLLFALALFINAFGIAAITRGLLGTSPITSVTYVLSMFTPLTIGQWTILLNLTFVLLELTLMNRKELREDLRMYLLQIPISLCFGTFIDISMGVLSWLQPATYLLKLVTVVAGCTVLAAGISLEVKADVAMMSGEYFVRVISRRIKVEFGYVKLGFDMSLLILACLLSLVFLSGIKGVREGTLISALLVGPIVHFITPGLKFLDKWIAPPAGQHGNEHTAPAVHPGIITIARETGSGGHLLGEMLSEKLGVKLYDRELIDLVAKDSGFTREYVSENEQSISPNYLLNIIFSDFASPMEKDLCKADALFLSESRVIRKIAREQSCVIVGRCADYILKDWPEDSIARIFCCSSAAATKTDQARAAHYQHYTGKTWGDPHNYDLVINTSETGINEACSLVAGYFHAKKSGSAQKTPAKAD